MSAIENLFAQQVHVRALSKVSSTAYSSSNASYAALNAGSFDHSANVRSTLNKTGSNSPTSLSKNSRLLTTKFLQSFIQSGTAMVGSTDSGDERSGMSTVRGVKQSKVEENR